MIKFLFLILLSLNFTLASASEEFLVEVKRNVLNNNLIEGELFVNKARIGKTYERYDLRISPGIYPGFIRYVSEKHAIGPFGQIGEKGDFLLEIGDVEWSDGKKRTNLLFHAGNKVKHSQGCIMLGPVSRENGVRYLKSGHTLSKLREAFYGKEVPESSPSKNIKILIEGFSPNIIGSYEHTKMTGKTKIRNVLEFSMKDGIITGESTTFYGGNKANTFSVESIYMKDKDTYVGKVLGIDTTFTVSNNNLVRKNSFSNNQYHRTK